MRIVHVITRMIVGGAQEVALLCCAAQHQRGHEVTLITGPAIGPEGSLLETARAAGYRVEVIDSMRRAISPARDWLSYRQLVRRLREIRPDVVHTHSSKAGIVGRWAAAKARVPAIIHTIHGLSFTASNSPWANNAYKILERKTAPITSRIVCVADVMRQESLAAGIGHPDQYVTIYNGMDTQPFLCPPVSREEVRRQLGMLDQHVVVGTIGRLFHLKGHEELLDLAPDLCAKWPDLRFLWVGDGILREPFERRIRQMNLTDRFILTGLVPPSRIPELAGAMDVLAHPSHREGLALALAQGSLAARPVVTYDVGGNREALIDQQTGFLVPAFQKDRFRTSLEQLLADAPLRQSMGQAGRTFALARFDTKVMIDALEEVYRKALVHVKTTRDE